jgi:surface-anchored protein
MSLAVVSESIPSNTFDFYRPNDPRISRRGEWIKLEMLAVQGPGYVSSWQDAQIPLNQWWMSSYDGGRTLDSVVYAEPGDHIHVHWGFTQPGIYRVTFDTSAFVGGTGLPVRSDPVTLTFGVDDVGLRANPLPPLVGEGTGPGTASPGVDRALLAGPAELASALASTPSGSGTAPAVAIKAPTPETAQVDGVFAATTPRDPRYVAVPVVGQHTPRQLDAGLGDVLQNEASLLV